MKERPILFSGPLVRAILAGKKTQTRRIVRNAPPSAERAERQVAAMTCIDLAPGTHFFRWLVPGGISAGFVSPYGQPGDRLWVRETWADLTATHGTPWERRDPKTGLYEHGRNRFVWYRADGEQPGLGDCVSVAEPWRPSIFMRRADSRITLEVTGVRVERLQAITEEDAKAEGVETSFEGKLTIDGKSSASTIHTFGPDAHVKSFALLWNAINGDRATWASNPWVWVVSFRRIAP